MAGGRSDRLGREARFPMPQWSPGLMAGGSLVQRGDDIVDGRCRNGAPA